MAPRILDLDIGLDTLWSELVYSEARLLKQPLAAQFASVFCTLRELTEAVQQEQRAHWRMEVVAQAGVDEGDDALDDGVDETEHAFVVIREPRASARYATRYFKLAPNQIRRLGLESQLEVVRSWPGSLKTESEPELVAAGATMERAVTGGDVAIEERRKAFAATADHRVRRIVRLVEDVNAARLSVYGELVRLIEPNKLPRNWADRFFRREKAGKKTPSGPA